MIAPAGSGKTRVLTERARHLLTQWRLPASSVCLVAFNKRAQEEMSTQSCRASGAAGPHAQRDRVGDRQWLGAVRCAADQSDDHHRARRSSDHRKAGGVSAQAKLRPRGAVDRGAVAGATGPPRSHRGRVAVRRRRGWLCDDAAPISPRARGVAIAGLRRADRAGDRDPAHRYDCSGGCPASLPRAVGRRVPGPDARPPPAGATAGRARRVRVRRGRRRPDDLRVQRRGPAVADRLRGLLPARRGPPVGGQLPLPVRRRVSRCNPAAAQRAPSPEDHSCRFRDDRDDDRTARRCCGRDARGSSPRRLPTDSRRARSRC